MSLINRGEPSSRDESGLAGANRGAVRIHEAERTDRLRNEDLSPIQLGALETGETGIVCDFLAGRSLVGRMAALGFTPDAQVTMVQNFGHGPVIVSVRGTRIALGRGEAQKVRIKRLDSEP